MEHYVYEISSPDSNKVYIGVSMDPNRRWEQHQRSNLVVGRAIRKYGNCSMEIIETMPEEQAYELEQFLLENIRTDLTWNMCRGGKGAGYSKLKTANAVTLFEVSGTGSIKVPFGTQIKGYQNGIAKANYQRKEKLMSEKEFSFWLTEHSEYTHKRNLRRIKKDPYFSYYESIEEYRVAGSRPVKH